MVLRMKNFDITAVHWKIPLLWGGGKEGSHQTSIEGWLLKKGAWTICRFKGRLARWYFWGGVDTPMHTMAIWKVFLNEIEQNALFNIEEIM